MKNELSKGETLKYDIHYYDTVTRTWRYAGTATGTTARAAKAAFAANPAEAVYQGLTLRARRAV